MKRILIIDPSNELVETSALLLQGEYELVRLDSLPERAALKAALAGASLVITSSGRVSSMEELVYAVAEDGVSALILADSEVAAASIRPAQDGVACLVKPFSPYDFKATVERLLSRPALRAPAGGITGNASNGVLDFPFLSQVTARLARRFAATSLPVLVWGELGCGQGSAARAILDGAENTHRFLCVNSADMGVDYLKAKRSEYDGIRENRASPAILLEGLDRLSLSRQSALLEFIDEIERTRGRPRFVASANSDLLERVYRGEFLERLYYKFAKLALPVEPLRRRRNDIPALARWFAGIYARDAGLDKVSFTPAAVDRLRNHLWFGNIDEFESVIARTLAIHGKDPLDAADVVFDVSALSRAPAFDAAGAFVESGAADAKKTRASGSSLRALPSPRETKAAKKVPHAFPDLRLLVHELAHELKNPMVTIKTFAQLLAERYDDAGFRSRFQNVVDDDIERMDELLEAMTEFVGFEQPHAVGTVLLKEQIHSALEQIHDECAKRQVSVGWKGNGPGAKIVADTAQLQYALKNTLLAVLSQARVGSEIALALGKRGSVTISYLREQERTQSLANYFNGGSAPDTEGILPLRIILAREIVERSGGRIGMDQADKDHETVTMEFPVG